MMEYGYVRVSTEGQSPERQVDKMRELGIPEANIVVDVGSGKDLDRAGWQWLMGAIAPGDRLTIDELDRLGRSYDDQTREWRRITREVGCDIKALNPEFFDSAAFRAMGDVGIMMEDMLLSLLAWKSQSERDTMLRRQAEGIAVAKRAGRYEGRKPICLDDALKSEAQRVLLSEGKAAAARFLGVSKGTLYNMIGDGRLVA